MGHFSWLVDGPIVGLYLLATMAAGIAVRKYVGKVEHFLVAGREMNVYLGIASLAATEFGIVTCMYTAQLGYDRGFAGATPGICMAGAMLLVGLTGFCVKPLRDSGVVTIPELLERRFGPRIRRASAVVIVLGGLLNMGVFLRIGGDFLVYATGLDPDHLEITMTFLLLAVAAYTILGGMLSVLVTDYLQFVVMSAGLIAVTVLIFVHPDLGWGKLVGAVEERYGAGGFNPIRNPDLGWQFVLFQSFHNLAAVLTWQTTIQRLLSAKDTATGRRIYTRTSFFFVCRFLVPGIWGIAALASLAPAAFDVLPADLAEKKSLYAMPLFLGGGFVSTGLMGILVAAMLAADMSTDSSYMLTWGSVIYNDLLAPFRKGPVSERRGILWNRAIVAAIGIYLLLFGLWFPVKGNVWDYLSVTGTIYLSSMSALLIAACYWRRANSWGAAAAIVSGAVIPTAFLVLQQLPYEWSKELAKDIGPNWSGLAAYTAVATAMVVGSFLKPKASCGAREVTHV